MKICYVVPWFPSKDAKTQESQQGIFEYRNVLKLSERGYKFKIITMKWKGQLEIEKINENVEVIRLPFYFSLVRYPLPHFYKLIKQIIEINSTWNPDVITYSHTIFLTALPSLFLKYKINKPIVAITDCIPGVNWFYGNKIVDSIGYIHSKTLGKIILNRADGIRLLSSHNYNDILDFGIEAEKLSIITRGVNDQTFRPRKADENLKKQLKIKENEKIILFVGRLDQVKGVDYLIPAAKKIVSKYDHVRFFIVGDGSLKAKYEDEAKEFDKIQFLGFRDDIPDLMNIADMFVLTSLSEGACNVVLEASASGLPVIATKVGEVPQIILDGKTGILIDPKDVNSLHNSIKIMLEDPKLCKNMGKLARQHIEENYTEDAISNKIENFYSEVLMRWNDNNKPVIFIEDDEAVAIDQTSK